MNRLSSFFQNQKLAKLYIAQADEYIRKKELEKAVGHMTAAMGYLMTAMNNVASIAFHQKPKGRKNT